MPDCVGMWLSLVEHLVRDQGVAGSNPVIPTMISKGCDFPGRNLFLRLFCDYLSPRAPRTAGGPSNREAASPPGRRLYFFGTGLETPCKQPVLYGEKRFCGTPQAAATIVHGKGSTLKVVESAGTGSTNRLRVDPGKRKPRSARYVPHGDPERII